MPDKDEVCAKLLVAIDAIDDDKKRKSFLQKEADFLTQQIKSLKFGVGQQGSDVMLKYFNSSFDREIFHLMSFSDENQMEHVESYVDLLYAGREYIIFLRNLKKLNDVVNTPLTYKNISPNYASELKSIFLKTINATEVVAVKLFNKENLAGSSHLKQLDVLNKSVLALTFFILNPRNQKKFAALGDAANNLNELKASRPVSILKSCWKKIISLSQKIFNNKKTLSVEKGKQLSKVYGLGDLTLFEKYSRKLIADIERQEKRQKKLK